jgi:hypothetical protein
MGASGIYSLIFGWQQFSNTGHDQVNVVLAGFATRFTTAFDGWQQDGFANSDLQLRAMTMGCALKKIVGGSDNANRNNRHSG